jgi:hypothetical protein
MAPGTLLRCLCTLKVVMKMTNQLLEGCDGCGAADLPSISATLHTAIKYLVDGHAGVRELYKVLERKATSVEDKERFRLEAEKHDRIAHECAMFVLPEESEASNGARVETRQTDGVG